MGIKPDPRKQFSKWLAKSGAIYWIIYNTLLLILIAFRPEVAMPCVYLAIIVSIVMIWHVVCYTRNSLGEKMLLTLIDKTNIELNAKGKDSDGNEEEVSNG